MNPSALHRRAAAVLLLACAGSPALAQDATAGRVEVTGTRYDIHALCATIDDDLRVQLARRLAEMPPQALVQVAFHLDGRRIDGVETTGASFDARRAVRRSVQQIACDNGNAGRQRVRFDVVYRRGDSAEPGTASAGRSAPTVVAVVRGR